MQNQIYRLKKPEIPTSVKISRKLIGMVAFAYYANKLKKIGRGTYIGLPCYFQGHDGIEMGRSVTIWPRNRLEARHTETQKGRILIGDMSILQPFCHIGAAMEVIIGSRVLIASNVYITDHDHAFEFGDNGTPLGHHKDIYAKKVIIEDHVWLGEKVCVLKGVTIGYASIVGAGSVVSKSIPPYSIAVGNPARVIKKYDAASKSWKPFIS